MNIKNGEKKNFTHMTSANRFLSHVHHPFEVQDMMIKPEEEEDHKCLSLKPNIEHSKKISKNNNSVDSFHVDVRITSALDQLKNYIESIKQNDSDININLSSPSDQLLFSAVLATLIPDLSSSTKLTMDPTSPEFIASLSRATTQYLNPNYIENSAFSRANNPVPDAIIGTKHLDGTTRQVPKIAFQSLTLPTKPQRSSFRLNKFVRRLHDMLLAEKDKGIVEWRCGMLVLHSTDAFAKIILPKYFNTRNFKTFRRQLNYYGFVHVRSFSASGSSTTALWINQELANRQIEFSEDCNNISSVLSLKRVDPCYDAKTARIRKARRESQLKSTCDAEEIIQPISISFSSVNSKPIHLETTLKKSDTGKGVVSNHSVIQNKCKPQVQYEKARKQDNLTQKGISLNPTDHHMTNLDAPKASPHDAANLLLSLSRSTIVQPFER